MGNVMSVFVYVVVGWMLFNVAFAACFIVPVYRH
jgi:hypothetical protein